MSSISAFPIMVYGGHYTVRAASDVFMHLLTWLGHAPVLPGVHDWQSWFIMLDVMHTPGGPLTRAAVSSVRMVCVCARVFSRIGQRPTYIKLFSNNSQKSLSH